MDFRHSKGGNMPTNGEQINEKDELERHIWKQDTIIVNGQQVTIMYPPDSPSEK